MAPLFFRVGLAPARTPGKLVVIEPMGVGSVGQHVLNLAVALVVQELEEPAADGGGRAAPHDSRCW